MADVNPAAGTTLGMAAGLVLDILGVDIPPLMWSVIGASVMQGYSTVEVPRFRVLIQVVGSGLLGTIIGLTITNFGGITYEPARYLACALGGFGAHPVLQALLKRLIERIEGAGK